MGKQYFKAGNMVYPVPVVMISCKREDENQTLLLQPGVELSPLILQWHIYLSSHADILMT